VGKFGLLTHEFVSAGAKKPTNDSHKPEFITDQQAKVTFSPSIASKPAHIEDDRISHLELLGGCMTS
jgi:hypothetical protein